MPPNRNINRVEWTPQEIETFAGYLGWNSGFSFSNVTKKPMRFENKFVKKNKEYLLELKKRDSERQKQRIDYFQVTHDGNMEVASTNGTTVMSNSSGGGFVISDSVSPF